MNHKITSMRIVNIRLSKKDKCFYAMIKEDDQFIDNFTRLVNRKTSKGSIVIPIDNLYLSENFPFNDNVVGNYKSEPLDMFAECLDTTDTEAIILFSISIAGVKICNISRQNRKKSEEYSANEERPALIWKQEVCGLEIPYRAKIAVKEINDVQQRG